MEKIVIAQLSVQEKKVDQFIKLVKKMVEKSNQETGCITYKLLYEIDKPTEYIIYEKYINEKAVDLHNNSKHFKVFINSVLDTLLDKPIIDVY